MAQTREGEALGWERREALHALITPSVRRTPVHAQATLWQAGRVGAEPGGAAALAALLAGPYQPRPVERVGAW